MSRLDPETGRQPYLCGVGGVMIDLPHRGNMLVAQCRGCGHEVRFTGREIVTRFTKWLPAPAADWAATLRCGECQSRWIMVHAVADGAAQGFFQATTEMGGGLVWRLCKEVRTANRPRLQRNHPGPSRIALP